MCRKKGHSRGTRAARFSASASGLWDCIRVSSCMTLPVHAPSQSKIVQASSHVRRPDREIILKGGKVGFSRRDPADVQHSRQIRYQFLENSGQIKLF